MRENEFERKVHEQLEELRIRPSDETWERVEKELREKKKRRAAVLVFIMAGLLLLGYSGYTFLSRSSSQPVAQNETAQKNSSAQTTQPSTTPTTTTNNTTTNNNNPAVAESSETTPTTNQPDQNRNANPSLKHGTVKDIPVTTDQVRTKKSKQIPAIANPANTERTAIVKGKTDGSRQKKNAIAGQKKNNQIISGQGEADIVKNPVEVPEKKTTQQPADKQDDINSNSIASNTINNNREQISVDSAAAMDSTVAKTEIKETENQVIEEQKPAIAKNKNKWKFGVEVSAGFISSQNKVFGFIDGNGMKSLFDQSNAPQNGSTNANPGGGNPRVIIPPSDIKEGKELKIGLVAEKAISKRSSLSAGLRYSYADESLVVGSIRDTMVRSNSYSVSQNFFAASGIRNAYSSSATAIIEARRRTNYTNRYHFLEIPLLFQTQLNKGKKMGFLWNAGIAPGFLVSTNALVYDTAAGGIYYKNDKMFKRFHFNMQTGFALQFGNSKKIQWSLGPTVSLDMTRLMKEDVFTEKRYFLYTGLTGRVFLNSRKK